ncbi:MAG: ABC transporter ATP-binding protein [Clostridia bacterium]|nr:ABC transporter ATP-binding protein [Clostridia bacterium]
MSEKILEIRNLSKSYGSRLVLRNLNFEVYAGEIFGFIGPNGAGKSTLIRIMSGLTPPTSGDVFICGRSIQTEFQKAIANVGVVMENCELYHYMTGRQNLQYFTGLIKGVTKQDIENAINIVGLTNRINDKVKTYSYGMRQRLGLAQALLHKPKLLILDEPTNGLDVNGIIELRQTLKILAAKQNMAIFVSSHILSEMEQLCDTVAIFDHGNILELRTLADLQDNSGGKKHIQIKVDYPNYAGKIISLKFGIEAELAGRSIILPYMPDYIEQFVQALKQRDVTVFGVSVISKSLEDIYLDILKERKLGNIK